MKAARSDFEDMFQLFEVVLQAEPTFPLPCGRFYMASACENCPEVWRTNRTLSEEPSTMSFLDQEASTKNKY